MSKNMNQNKKTNQNIEAQNISIEELREKVRQANNKADWDQLLKEMRGHYGKLSEVIMELIDNASSVFEKFNLKKGLIQIFITQMANDTLHVIVRDNGNGIQDIDAALSMGKRSVAMTALSGHGMGFKNLPVEKITLRTVNQNGDAYEIVGPFIEGVNIQPYAGFPDGKTGTEFEFEIKGTYFNADIARWGERTTGTSNNRTFFMLCDCLAEHIGVVIGKRMIEWEHEITIYATDIKNKKKTFKVEPLTLNINPMKLVVTHPELGMTKGTKIVPAFDGSNTSITVDYEFGYGTPSRRSKRGYFNYNQVSQGWYVSINGRYIGKTATIGVRETHPCMNGLMGWVDLKVDYAEQAPQTEIAKTGFVQASHGYNDLLSMIQGLIPNLNEVMNREIKTANIHDIMRDELYQHCLSMGRVAGKEVLVPGKSGQKVDVMDYDGKTLYEIKSKAAKTSDVYQIYGYVAAYVHNEPMNVPFNSVVLCATDFPEEAMGALEDANSLLESYDLKIEIKHLHEVEGIKTLPIAKNMKG